MLGAFLIRSAKRRRDNAMENVDEQQENDVLNNVREAILDKASIPDIVCIHDRNGNERHAVSYGRTMEISPQPTLHDEIRRNPEAALENRRNRLKRLIKDMLALKNPVNKKLIQDDIERLKEESEIIENYIASNSRNSNKTVKKKKSRR